MTNETVRITAVGRGKKLRLCFMACKWKFDSWMTRDTVSKVEVSQKPKSVIFEETVKVVLSRVITLGKLDLDSKAGLPTKTHSLLLMFSFK